MIFYLLVLLVEFIACFCSVDKMTYVFGLSGLYQIARVMYFAWHSFGVLAYILAFVAHIPFMFSFIRMYWHDSETRRKIFYKIACRVWVVSLFTDIWVVLNLMPETHEICQAHVVRQ